MQAIQESGIAIQQSTKEGRSPNALSPIKMYPNFCGMLSMETSCQRNVWGTNFPGHTNSFAPRQDLKVETLSSL